MRHGTKILKLNISIKALSMKKFQIKSQDGMFWDYSCGLIKSASNTYLFELQNNEYIMTEDKKYLCYNDHFFYDVAPEFRMKVTIVEGRICGIGINDKNMIDCDGVTTIWEFIYPEYFIVASCPYSFSWTNSTLCTDDSSYTFSITNNEIKTGNNYLCYSNERLYFSQDATCKANIILVPCTVLHNYYLQIAGTNKFIRHYCSEIRADEFDSSELYEKDRTWLIIPALIDETHEVVVARYKEDVRWTRFIPAKVIIYNKGLPLSIPNPRGNINIASLQNVGREGHTYLHYIRERYNTLPGTVSFIQGDPMPHGDHIFNMLCMKKYYSPVQSMSAWYSKKPSEERLYQESKVLLHGAQSSRFMFDNEYNYLPGKTHKFYFCGIPCGPPLNKFKYDCSINQKTEGYTFMVAGIFSVSAYRIICNPLSFYENCSKILLSKNKQGGREGYSLEFFWATIFGE
jgi:hypothetical protein